MSISTSATARYTNPAQRQPVDVYKRQMKDMHRAAPGCFLPFILYSMAEALSPYAAIWLSAQLINELASLRRPEVLAKWAVLVVAVSAALELVKAALEHWRNVSGEDVYKRQIFTIQR